MELIETRRRRENSPMILFADVQFFNFSISQFTNTAILIRTTFQYTDLPIFQHSIAQLSDRIFANIQLPNWHVFSHHGNIFQCLVVSFLRYCRILRHGHQTQSRQQWPERHRNGATLGARKHSLLQWRPKHRDSMGPQRRCLCRALVGYHEQDRRTVQQVC